MSFCGLGEKAPKRGKGAPFALPAHSDWIDINGVKVSMERGDITLSRGDAVVAGEDRGLTAKGAVMKALCNAGGKKYRKQRKKLKKHLEREAGVAGRQQRVYTTKGGKLGYTHVLHAMMPQHRPGQNWYNDMKQLYTDVISEAEEHNIKVMRMPVLGSGAAAGRVDVSVKALLDAVKGYSPFEHLRHLVLMDTNDSHIRSIQQEMQSRRDGSPKYNTPSQGPPVEERDPRVKRSLSVGSPHRSNYHSSSNSHLVQVNQASGAAWNGHDQPWREERRNRGDNSSATKGGNSRERAHEAEGFGSSHEAEELSDFDHQDKVRDGKKKAGTIPRERKPRSQRVFDYEGSPPFHPEDFRHSNKSQAQPAWSALTGDTSRPQPREGRPSHFQDGRSPPAHHHSRELQPRFDQRPQERTSREPYPLDMENELKPPPRTHRPSPKLAVKQPSASLAAQSVNSHATALVQSPPAQVPQTRTAAREKAAGPQGKMVDYVKASILPGHPGCGTVVIEYSFANGVQGHTDPRPGQPYKGIFKRAYLPDSAKGKELLRLLKVAFDLGLLFEIRADGRGGEDTVTLRNIPHKTSVNGGPERDAYPDPDYLDRLERALVREGVPRDARL